MALIVSVRVRLACLLLCQLVLASVPAGAQVAVGPQIMATAKALVSFLKEKCPVAPPGDAEAFKSCQSALFASEDFGHLFAPSITWGGAKEGVPVWQSPNTRFDSTLFRSLYLPLFMFDGKFTIAHEEPTSWTLVKLHVAFRNGLGAGEFPYPFWHDGKKWDAYQAANELIFRIDPVTAQIWNLQRNTNPEIATIFVPPVPSPAFDGKWTWSDGDKKFQPAVTLYDGIFDGDNPYKSAMSEAYKDFALSLRDKSCVACHNPSNPRHMRPLVLLQTPAHAAGEIKALIAAVSDNRMPLTEWGLADPMNEADKLSFLRKARAFDEAAARAFAWEKANHAKAP